MNLLWKKASKNPDAPYVDIFRNFAREYPAEYKAMTTKSKLPTPTKSDSVSKDLRENGNMAFKFNRWTDAMAYYNQSLCFAEVGSENVALAYSNRSACFFHLKMYQKCIFDIDLAIEVKCPERLLSKLESRRADCLKAMPLELQQKAPQLDFEENKNFPGLASVLQMKSNTEFGRYFAAKTDVDIGKVVLVEEPFITTPLLDKKAPRCHTCFAFGANFIACEKCTKAIFCSPECMSNGFHEISCAGKHRDVDFIIEYAARSILTAVGIFPDVGDLIKFVEPVVHAKIKVKEVPNSTIDSKDKYRVFLHLNLWISDEVKKGIPFRAYELYDYLMTMPTIKQQFEPIRHKRFLMHFSVMHFWIISCNIFINQIGGGVYPLANHFNHSCAPNILGYQYGNKKIYITSRPIKEGEQLFISYIDRSKGKNVRQAMLFQSFNFRCNCEKCEYDGKAKDAHRLNQIEADPVYQFVKNNSVDEVFGHIQEYFTFRKKCFDVITKYGHGPWTKQLDLVSTKLQVLVNDAETIHYFDKALK